MFRKILFPTDFSDFSKKALEYIKGLKDAGCEEVVILHVIEQAYIDAYEEAFSWAGKDVEKMTEKLSDEMIGKAKERMREIVEKLKDFKVKEVVRIGNPEEEILKCAEEEDVDLIVIGSHGCGRITCSLEKLIGSTAENVIRHSKKPVLIVR